MVGMCAKGFSCTGLFREVVHDYVARHKLDLHMQSSTLEPTLPVAYSKLPQLQRLLRFGYEWIWWLDCDALILQPDLSPINLLGLHGITSDKAEPPTELEHAPPPGVTYRATMVIGWEVWGWVDQSHPLNTGSFFLRGISGGETDRLLTEWALRSEKFTQHVLWEQQGLFDLLKDEKIPGRSRAPTWLRNGTVLAFGNPSFNTLLCPTSRSLAGKPAVLHVTRGVTALGRCSAESLPLKKHLTTKAFKTQDWKGVLLARVLQRGLQEVRDECCRDYPFTPKLLKKHWGGVIDRVSKVDRYPAKFGVRDVVAGQLVQDIASELSVCGSPGDNSSLLPEVACDEESWWFKNWQREREKRSRGEEVRPFDETTPELYRSDH